MILTRDRGTSSVVPKGEGGSVRNQTLANGGAGFSTDNVEVNTATPESGNVKFSVTPKKGNGERELGKARFLLFPCEDETVENTTDFRSVSYHRILRNAVVTLLYKL